MDECCLGDEASFLATKRKRKHKMSGRSLTHTVYDLNYTGYKTGNKDFC